MKKLLTITTVLFAGIFGTAQADVTVSGSAEVIAKSIGSKTIISNGGAVSFGLSTTLENGMTISNSGITLETSTDTDSGTSTTDQNDGDAFFITTFAMGGSSLAIGADVEVDYADLDVGSVTSDNASRELATSASAWSEGTMKGPGFTFSTSMGSAAISVGHVMDNTTGGDDSSNDINASGAVTASGVKVSLPIGPLSATIGYHTDATTASGVNATGVSAAYALPAGGTISAAYQSSDSKAANSDAIRISAKYATSLGDGTAVSVGYTSTDQDTKASTTDLEVSVSRSIGTGASLFIDFHNRTGTTTANAGTSAVAVGTSVAF